MKKQYSITTSFKNFYIDRPEERFMGDIFEQVENLKSCLDFELISITYDRKKSIITWKCSCEDMGF